MATTPNAVIAAAMVAGGVQIGRPLGILGGT